MDELKIGQYTFASRLILGTGKYPSPEIMNQALHAAGCDLVTVAVRRVNLKDPADPILGFLDKKFRILPNTAGCFSADEAIRTARLAREVGLSDMVKLEVIGDRETLYPDLEQLVVATRQLVKEGFVVMPYTTDDLVTALRLLDAGAACIMPLGSPIGSGLGVLNPVNIQILRRRIQAPIILDAGVGTASDVAVAMELGVDGVLLNTGVACARDPVRMAAAVKHACIAGRLAYLAGRIPKKMYASPSSPEEGRIE